MKSKEEIKKLEDEQFERGNIHEYELGFIKGYEYGLGFIKGQEDILDALEMHITINEHDWNRNPQAQLKDFIESLNKKDNESN